MTLDWILGWQNLIYLVPFGLALLYLLLYAASGLTFGDADADASGGYDADADADVDADVDADADVDVDADADHDAGADGDHDHDHDHDHDVGDASPLKAALTWLGVGRVPLSILLMVLFLAWGATGFVVNQIARPTFAEDWQVAIASLPAALLTALLTTRLVVRAIDRWIPLDETTARRRHDLLGLAGTAIYAVDERFGMLSVRDDRGELHQVPCRLAAGHPPVPKHGRAVLVSYNAKDNLYGVIPEAAVGTAAAAAEDARRA